MSESDDSSITRRFLRSGVRISLSENSSVGVSCSLSEFSSVRFSCSLSDFSSVGFSVEIEWVVAHDKRGRFPNPKLSPLKINVFLPSPQILGSNGDSTRHFSAGSSVLPSFCADDEPAQE